MTTKSPERPKPTTGMNGIRIMLADERTTMDDEVPYVTLDLHPGSMFGPKKVYFCFSIPHT